MGLRPQVGPIRLTTSLRVTLIPELEAVCKIRRNQSQSFHPRIEIVMNAMQRLRLHIPVVFVFRITLAQAWILEVLFI
jgi:hypothetical protein